MKHKPEKDMKKPAVYTLILLVSMSFLIADFAQATEAEDVVGFWTLELTPGYNLVSFPVLPAYPSPELVLGDRLGDVEISTFDRAIQGYRWAKYDAETDNWTGDLYILTRGKAYWIKLPNAESQKRLVVIGRPEEYRKFSWSELRDGWNFYAPVYGKNVRINDLPPDHSKDMLIGWDPENQKFQLATAGDNQRWSPGALTDIESDNSYIVYLNKRRLRASGPPTTREDKLDPTLASVEEGEGGLYATGRYSPPVPLIVGNSEGLPVCSPDGEICNGGFTVNVVRMIGDVDNDNYITQLVATEFVSVGGAIDGKFKVALAVGGDDSNLQPGDVVALQVTDRQNATSNSTMFTVPATSMMVPDVSFNQPMSTEPVAHATPTSFAMGKAFPNPFNERFSVDVSVPDAGDVHVRMYDITGRLVKGYTENYTIGTHRLTVDGQGFSAGVYYLEVSQNEHRAMTKVAYIK